MCANDPTTQDIENTTTKRREGEYGWLKDYESGNAIRPATKIECYASRYAAQWDDGAGVIVIGGRSCWVDEQ